MKSLFAILVSSILTMACSNSNNELSSLGQRTIAKIDTLLRLPFQSSGSILLVQSGDTALVIDQNFCTIQLLDLNTKSVLPKKYFGLIDSLFQGQTIKAACVLSDGRWFLQNGYNCWWLSHDLEQVEKDKISFPHTQAGNEMEENPSYKNPAIYEPDFTLPSVIALSPNEIIFPIVAEHPFFNGFNTNAFYQNAFAMAIYSNGVSKKMKLIGKRTGIYHSKKFIPSFYSAMAAAWRDNQLIIGFEADSFLHVYDNKGKRGKSFGQSGSKMTINYPTHQDIEFAYDTEAQQMERAAFGRYLQLATDKSGTVLARTYSCGNKVPTTNNSAYGLQLYKNYQLLADLPLLDQYQLMNVTDNLEVTLGMIKNDTLTIIRTKSILE